MAPNDNAAVDDIRHLFARAGYVMLGPINAGRDAEAKRRAGWVAPYARSGRADTAVAAGHGWTPREAAEDAWAQFEAEIGSPPGTAE
jgi:hypothetical protein